MEIRSLMKKTICSAIILILLALPARAFDNFTYTSSRAFSMGKAFTGLSDDESAIYYNPAGLAYVDQRSEGLSGVYQDYSWSYTSLSSTLSPLRQIGVEKKTGGTAPRFRLSLRPLGLSPGRDRLERPRKL